MFKNLYSVTLGAAVGLMTLNSAFAGETPNAKNRVSRTQQPVEIKVFPVGVTQELIDRTKAQVEGSAAVRKELRGTSYRLLSFDYFNTGGKQAVTPDSFRVVFYDYTNERSVVAEGAFAAAQNIRVYEENTKPLPSEEEFDYAFEVVRQSSEFGAALKAQNIRVSRAMPPVTEVDGERLINLAVESLDSSERNEVIGISLKRAEVVRYPNNAPLTSKASPDACGIPATQGSTGRGVAGEYQMIVSQNGTTLWEMLITRPSASSGSSGSGIDLQNVKYRGKMVLKRGHAPVLNVKYAGNTCGPYLDWQYAEGFFNAPDTGATDPAPGIRVLGDGQIATTALESGNDFGNFQGVAIYTQNDETVMVTEMNAGWYRYIMEWRFANDGTIRPRYGFGATNSSCVCSVHYHHVYWRFDFDIVNANNKIYQMERGRKFQKQITNESAILRNYQTNRGFLIQNGSGDEAYSITPNLTDGKYNDGDATFGGGDFWLLKTAANNGELGTTSNSAINMSPYLNNESIDNTDLTVWYAGHFTHSDGGNLLDPDRYAQVLSGSHVIGPDIRPIRW